MREIFYNFSLCNNTKKEKLMLRTETTSLQSLEEKLAELNTQIRQHHDTPRGGIIPPHMRAEILQSYEAEKAEIEKQIENHPDYRQPHVTKFKPG